MTDELPWKPLEVPPGELPILWRKEHSHALSFRFSGHDDDEWEIEADVKWDGCVNWQTNPGCLYHFCEPEHLALLVRAFHRAWAFTALHLDVADPPCFDRVMDQIPEELRMGAD